MGRYLFEFYGSIWPETPEEQQKVMGDWEKWFEQLGDAVAEQGAPTIQGKIVGKDGVIDIGENPLKGYTVIKADNLDAAVRLAEGCPGIPEGGQIAVYELAVM
jgi:hypothetical protein